MIAKEWRDSRWMFLVATLVFLAGAALVPTPYEEILEVQEGTVLTYEDSSPIPGAEQFPTPAEFAGQEVAGIQMLGGALTLVPLAALLGVALISRETSRNTIFLLLSRPIGRDRVLLTKYFVAAGGLLAVALIGWGGLVVSSYAHGFPPISFNVVGVLLSMLLLWLGSLFILGMALLMSVVFGGVIKSTVAAGLVLYLILAFESWMNYSFSVQYHKIGISEETLRDLRLYSYWFDEGLFLGESFASTNFLVCLVTASIPLLATLWLFHRKSY